MFTKEELSAIRNLITSKELEMRRINVDCFGMHAYNCDLLDKLHNLSDKVAMLMKRPVCEECHHEFIPDSDLMDMMYCTTCKEGVEMDDDAMRYFKYVGAIGTEPTPITSPVTS